ncbi:uncharacterized protein LOC121956694 [Plectropomus leopardus]|uniref:uncharacterized protein LOC121956694 n=1 Tax=Plectropomus leopardus TaxID=160734 RepID=UPI001C4BD126|nr:uncharacterized protein LOC121956694 [Plectropomus leopardus]
MMKTLCVVVIVLSLGSVCQAASLACEKLLKPLDKAQDFSGSWYVIAFSTEKCLVGTLMNAILWPSVAVDITPKTTPNVYSAKVKAKVYGYCETDSEDFFYKPTDNKILEVDINDAPFGEPDGLLQSSCPDCIVIKSYGDDFINTFMLLSRRENVSDAEQKEFEAQVECSGWSKPQVLNTDHDYKNCPGTDSLENDSDAAKVFALMRQRLQTNYQEPLTCLVETFRQLPSAAYTWAKETWNGLW